MAKCRSGQATTASLHDRRIPHSPGTYGLEAPNSGEEHADDFPIKPVVSDDSGQRLSRASSSHGRRRQTLARAWDKTISDAVVKAKARLVI
jgi:hypothetical protein